jgi:hypothetical protein
MEEMLGELDESTVERAREAWEALSAAMADDQTAEPYPQRGRTCFTHRTFIDNESM